MDLSFTTENSRYAFGSFDRVTVDGRAFRLHMETEVGVVMTQDDDTGCSRQFSHQDLSRLGSLGRIRVERNYFNPDAARKRQLAHGVSLSALSGRPLRRFVRKDAFCEAAIDMHRENLLKFTDASIAASMAMLAGRAGQLARDHVPSGVLNTLPSENMGVWPSPRTLRRWLAERNDLNLIGHLDNMDRRGWRGTRIKPEAAAIMHREIQGYLSPDKPTMQQIYENVALAIHERNAQYTEKKHHLSVPSRETVRRAIRALDPFRVEVARNGEAAARKKFRPVLNGLNATRPLERVEIDEWTVNVSTLLESTNIYGMLSDDEKRQLGLYIEGDDKDPRYKKKPKATDRWTLTAAICCATRCIVGMVLSRSANSEAAVQLLQMITTNKGAWADAVGALTPWDMHGTPELIVFDGGSAFKSMRCRMAAEDLGVMWEMAMNGVPENRGTIERVFKTFGSDFAPRLSGHTFASIMEKGDADPEKRAALTLDDFTFALLRWVIDIYHNTPHHGLGGETPVKAWRRLSKLHGVTPPPDAEMMRLCFGQEREYRLDKTGITILGVRYQSEEMQTYLRREHPEKVSVRWHPKDIGAISVKWGKTWCNVPALDTSLQGVAAQTWLTAVRHVRDANPKSNRLDNVAVRDAITAIKARNEAAMAAAGLNLEDWSEKRCAKEEKKLLAGIEFVERKELRQVKDGLGMEIPASSELTVAAEKPSTPETPAKPAKRAAKGRGITPTSPKSNMTIEEN
ncbi:Mu transposase C-terminal domain-containing protein [Tritonibacter mobilis]|uniref:Mu transposase C-terminal domain-containing protein n=3 Tax=Tritonibacter mobilis TaxID=379347 RepID=UPI0024BBBDC5|nr:Mu transposase C-terminal domain-containing protein [Tritonibacter mobilis]WHQ83245.1 Mu transposase C-terminal domain-containing protein [Tritonibacter mobilis]